MALASWMLRSEIREPHGRRRNMRTGNISREEDLFTSYLKLEPHECFKNLLRHFCNQNIEEKDLLDFLNTFVKLLVHYEDKFEDIRYTRKDFLLCLRLTLLNESSIIRSAGLRCIRHTIQDDTDVVSINNLLIHFLISKSLDLKIDMERIQAIKLIRKIGMIAPNLLDISMVRSLISLANEGSEGKDRLLRICLATLSEICLINPDLFINAGGVAAITRNLIDCQIPKIAESLCGILLWLMDKPETRAKAEIDLYSIAAPFCDFHYKHGWKDKTRDERKIRLNCSRLALLTVLKSWPGLLHFCNPKNQGGFMTIVEVLHLKQVEVRKAVLDLLYDLLGLQQPEWTDELSVALSAIDPCEPQSSWRLKEGFVASEGRSILPHLAKNTPSPTELHLALLLFCFLECGLLGALTAVITSSDTFISVRATVLLGELMRLIQLYLPPGCNGITPSMPALLEYATKSKPQALSAMVALKQLHKLMLKRPASYSLHLDYIIRNSSSGRGKEKQERHTRNKGIRSKLSHVKAVLKDGDDIVKETGVLSSNEIKIWNWNLIKMILRGERAYKLDLTDSSHRMFLRRLLDFFKPSQKKYSHTDLSNCPTYSSDLTTGGIEFVKYLGEMKDAECQAMVLDLFKDVHAQIKSISTSRSVHDCLFSPAHMVNTHCQSYFLFIGQFARSASGLSILESIKMFPLLLELATTTRHDCYVKLIISSLDYSYPGPAREILDAVLTCDVKTSRLYATQFLLVLLRAGYPSFAGWAIRLLCKQLDDKSSKVCLSALSTLQEACELPDCLETLTDLSVNLAKLGEKGELVAVKLLSTEKGYKKHGKNNILDTIKNWDTKMNYRYVKIVEGDISDCLTLHQKNEDGKYDRRSSNLSGTRSNYRKDIILPPHLFGQLNQHAEGFQMLTANGSITALVEIVHKANCTSDDEILKLKAALWAIGHFSTSNIGFNYLNSLEFVGSMIRIATKCPEYGVRSTAFYALGLVATTSLGSDELYLNRWLSTRHNRHNSWPVLQEELMDALYLSYFTNCIWNDGKESSEQLDGIREDDEITLSEEDERLIEYLGSPTLSPDIRKIKQRTLPVTRTPPEVFHKRSLSESKTFDTSNGYDLDHKYAAYENIIIRQRNSSMTESTTSGVSSCDSLPNRPGGGPSYLRTLSPIPSSTSLSILKLPYQYERRAHRISTVSGGSEASTSTSLSGSNNTNDLSLQNMLGYQTIRYIRRRDSLNFQRTERDDYLFRPPEQLSRRSVIDSMNSSEPVATIHYSSFTMPKFEPIYEPIKTYKPKDAIYRGICLPMVLNDVFPSEQQTQTSETIPIEETQIKFNTTICNNSSSEKTIQVWKHCKETCIYCSQKSQPLIQDFNDRVRNEILKIAERLANPVLSKAFKTQLLRLKQKDPEMFKDICLYSEVCKMFSECNYCLEARRILHELFLDVLYDRCYEDVRKLLGFDQNLTNLNKKEARKSDGDVVVSPTEFKTLDSLKLISAENKFPIRDKKNTD